MIIQCPVCSFRRDVPESALKPGKKYKITCPKCRESFSFSLPGEGKEEAASEAGAPLEQPAPKQEESREAPAVVAETPHLPTEREGDDPLPPGAQILSGEEGPVEKAEEPSPSREEEQGRGGWQGFLGFLSGFVKPAGKGAEEDAEPEAEEGTADTPRGAPWELPEHYGFKDSFTKTLLGVMFRPREFFSNVRCSMPLIRPALFYVLMTLYQVLVSRIWVMKSLREMMASVSDPQKLAVAENLMNSLNLPMALVVTPFIALFQVFFLAGVYHLMFRIVQPDKADFATTLRIVCYSSAPYILTIIPFGGSNIASLWFVAATFLGCKYALGIPWTRTLLAMLPLFLLELAVVLNLAIFMNS